jgi:hypothetical protein
MQYELLSNERFRILAWAVLAFLVLIADYFTGPFIQLPILFLCPVTLATWYSGRRWGLALACILPSIRISFSAFWIVPWTMSEATVNGIIQIAVLLTFAFLVDQTVQRKALSEELKLLRGILPICSFCKKIRNEGNIWEPLEKYISEHSEAEFSHGVCPPCAQEHYGKFLNAAKER